MPRGSFTVYVGFISSVSPLTQNPYSAYMLSIPAPAAALRSNTRSPTITAGLSAIAAIVCAVLSEYFLGLIVPS